MAIKNKAIYRFYKLAYLLLDCITRNIRISNILKLKIAIGIVLLMNETTNAQTVVFPTEDNKSDTLNLDFEMEEDAVTMCYEVIVIKNRREREPKYIGGQRALNKFVEKNVNYPIEALENKIEGDVAVNVTIDKHGKVIESEIIRKIGFGLDEEALRLTQILPKMRPGKINLRKVTMSKTIIFHFELPKK